MSVVVLGMEMPTGCADCETKYGFTINHEDGTTWCRVAKGYIGDKGTACPLRPLPEKHGRLVDANKAMNELKPCPFCGGTDLRLESFSGWGADVIICSDCLAVFSQMELTCSEDLIDAWNRRAGEDG